MLHNDPEEYLGIDWGMARVGVARGSSLAKIAEPLKTIPADQAIAEIANLAKTNHASAIVVGLARSLEGQDTSQTKQIRQWVKIAQTKIKLPFYWQDEALTTHVAEGQVRSHHGADALAASIILQDFLDTPQAQRVRC